MTKEYMQDLYGNSCRVGDSPDTKELVELMKQVRDKIRPGVGTKSSLMFCHPSVEEDLRIAVRKATDNPAVHAVRPFRVMTNPCLPESQDMKTGKILWKDTKYITYSDGPNTDITDGEYLSMCLFNGWAEEEVIKKMVFFELDRNTFLNHLDMAHGLDADVMRKHVEERRDKISREFEDLMVRAIYSPPNPIFI